MSDQADVRCPQCGALLRSGAQWCTLCYADLRPKPEPEPVAVTTGAPGYAEVGTPDSALDPSGAPMSALEAAAFALVHGTSPDPAAETPEAAVGWPCGGCQAVVPFDEDACPTCGTRFLDGARGEPDLLDRIGPGGLPVSTQTMIIAGGAVAIIAVIVASMYIIALFI